MKQPTGARPVALPARGVARASTVVHRHGDDSGEEILALVVTPDFDIADACAEIGRTYEGPWPPVVVVKSIDGDDPGPADPELVARLEELTRAPRAVVQRRLFLDLVVEILENPAASEDHYFFVDAGGDSITALQVSAEVDERFGFELPLEALVGLPIGRIADLVATTHLALADAGPEKVPPA